jgi:hypothetical protein
MDQEFVAMLCKELDRDEKIRPFEAVTGLRDDKVIECLVDAGFELSTLFVQTTGDITLAKR